MSLQVCFIFFVLFSSCHGNQTALLHDLFGSYINDVIPRCGFNESVEVKLGIAIRQLIDVDEPKQTILTNMWIRMTWKDCNLVWNPDDYGGVDSIVVPVGKVWTPDLTLFDNADFIIDGISDYRAIISSNGNVKYYFPTVITSMCTIDVTAFPFDQQECPLTFASWAYHGFELDITNLSLAGDVGDFKENSEWDMIGVPVKREVGYFGCCPEPYPSVTFTLNIRRKPLYYVLNTLFPCLLISQIALLGFILPVDSGEKIGLQVTVLLSLAVLMMIVSNTLPPTSEYFPLLGIYFVIAMSLVALSTVLTVIVVNVYFRGQLGHRVPGWVRTVFLVHLARFLCLTNPKDDKSDGSVQSLSISLSSSESDIKEKKMPENEIDKDSPVIRLIEEHLKVLKKADKEAMENQKEEEMENEWKTLAVVLDRLFLLIFFIVSVSATIGILVESTRRA